jgi:hypothetical protein
VRPTQPPIQWVPGALSLGVKRPGCEADHSPPSTAEVKVPGVIPPLPNTPSWRDAQLKQRDNLRYIKVQTTNELFLRPVNESCCPQQPNVPSESRNTLTPFKNERLFIDSATQRSELFFVCRSRIQNSSRTNILQCVSRSTCWQTPELDLKIGHDNFLTHVQSNRYS